MITLGEECYILKLEAHSWAGPAVQPKAAIILGQFNPQIFNSSKTVQVSMLKSGGCRTIKEACCFFLG